MICFVTDLSFFVASGIIWKATSCDEFFIDEWGIFRLFTDLHTGMIKGSVGGGTVVTGHSAVRPIKRPSSGHCVISECYFITLHLPSCMHSCKHRCFHADECCLDRVSQSTLLQLADRLFGKPTAGSFRTVLLQLGNDFYKSFQSNSSVLFLCIVVPLMLLLCS